MLDLTTAPIWISVLLFVVVLPLVALAGPVIVRRFVSLERLRGNNEVAGYKFATVGVLYAVLLAFVVVVVWEKFSQAENEVASEAGAAATLYRLWDGVGGSRDQDAVVGSLGRMSQDLGFGRQQPGLGQRG